MCPPISEAQIYQQWQFIKYTLLPATFQMFCKKIPLDHRMYIPGWKWIILDKDQNISMSNYTIFFKPRYFWVRVGSRTIVESLYFQMCSSCPLQIFDQNSIPPRKRILLINFGPMKLLILPLSGEYSCLSIALKTQSLGVFLMILVIVIFFDNASF